MTQQRLKDRIALITGASRGIGRAVALAYAREGAHVVLVARTVGGLEEVDDEIRELGSSATLVPMDLGDGKKVDGLGPTIYQRWGKLDIVVGNAAILGPSSPITHVSDADWQEAIDINVTANWRLIRTVDPLLRMSDAGRAIFVTSGAAQSAKAYRGPYSVTKAALDAMVKTYGAEVAATNVKVNLLSPGPTATAMRAQAMPGEDPATLPQPEDLAELFIELARPDCTRHGEIVRYSR